MSGNRVTAGATNFLFATWSSAMEAHSAVIAAEPAGDTPSAPTRSGVRYPKLTRPQVWALQLAVWGCVVAFGARASSVTVPDDYTSIQAAIDSGADTVLVRDGDYAEVPEAYRAITIRGIGERRARLRGLSITNPVALSTLRRLSDLEFTGQVTMNTFNYKARLLEIDFAHCALDSGLDHVYFEDPEDIEVMRLTRCTVGAACRAWGYVFDMDADTLDAGVSWGLVNTINVTNCWFRGGEGFGLDVSGQINGGYIGHNLFEGYTIGIHGTDLNGVSISGNVVRAMSDAGIDIHGDIASADSNVVSACSVGIRCDLLSEVTVRDNTLSRIGGYGVSVRQPFVLRAEGNVVSHCGASGVFLWTSTIGSDVEIVGNSLTNNGGAGVELSPDFTDPYGLNAITIRNNIGYGNVGWGVAIDAHQDSVALGCNDWFRNGLGAVSGVQSSAEDRAVDPGFCNLADDDVSLDAASPLVGDTLCGQIGARGVGCAVTATTLTRLSVTPEREGLALRWGFGVGNPPQSWIERSIQGADEWRSLGSGARLPGGEYALIDAEVVPGQTYVYRVAWMERRQIVRSAPATGQLSGPIATSAVWPNPSPGGVDVAWTLASPSETAIRVYDLAGRMVATVVSGRFDAGRHRAHWDGRMSGGDIARTGWYVVRVTRGDVRTEHRVLLIR